MIERPPRQLILYAEDGRIIAVTNSEAASFVARRLLRPGAKR